MNASRLQTLILLLAASMAGIAHAGAGDITKREQVGGSVELSNLGTDEGAQVVVAAPARVAVEPVARTVPAPLAHPVPEVAAVERQSSPASEGKGKRGKGEKGDAEATDEQGTSWSSEYAGGAATNGLAGYGGGFGGYGGGSGGFGGGSSGSPGTIDAGTGAGSTGGGGVSPAATGTGGSGSIGTGGSGTGYVNSNTNGAGTAPSAGLSPDQLALRVAQYRDAMLNEQRGANGLVANPAVQRRYLMINRAGYMGRGY